MNNNKEINQLSLLSETIMSLSSSSFDAMLWISSSMMYSGIWFGCTCGTFLKPKWAATCSRYSLRKALVLSVKSRSCYPMVDRGLDITNPCNWAYAFLWISHKALDLSKYPCKSSIVVCWVFMASFKLRMLLSLIWQSFYRIWIVLSFEEQSASSAIF